MITKKIQGDVEDLPFITDSFDRYVSAGSFEYWPEPQRAIVEAYRVIKPGGIALIIGPLQRQNPLARWLSDTWMLFPPETDYIKWYEAAGFTNIKKVYVEPDWYDKSGGNEYAIVIAGVKPLAGEFPLKLPLKQEDIKEVMTPVRLLNFVYRFFVGSAAGVVFIPIAIYQTLKAKVKGKPS